MPSVPLSIYRIIKALSIEALACHDALSGAFARLLLRTVPAPLPSLSNRDGAWEYYLRLWRPGEVQGRRLDRKTMQWRGRDRHELLPRVA